MSCPSPWKLQDPETGVHFADRTGRKDLSGLTVLAKVPAGVLGNVDSFHTEPVGYETVNFVLISTVRSRFNEPLFNEVRYSMSRPNLH